MSIDVMKQALEALEAIHRTGDTQAFDLCYANKVIPSLRAAIAQANEFEPDWDVMAVMVEEQQRMAKRIEELEAQQKPWVKTYTGGKPNYTSPVDAVNISSERVDETAKREHEKKEWVGLTDEEIKEIIGPWGETPIKGYTRKLFDQIEAKLKEKNHV